MGLFFRDREEDLADPDLRASRYFLFKNKQTEENKLKNAEKKYGYTLGELHAYRHFMKPPRMPELMQHERPAMTYTYDQIHKLVESEEYEQQTENHFATKPEEKSWSRKTAVEDINRPDGAAVSDLKVAPYLQHTEGSNTAAPVDESCVKCLGYYLALDRCVRAVSKEDEKNRVYKYTRLHACKPHWVRYAIARGIEPRKTGNPHLGVIWRISTSTHAFGEGELRP